MSRETLHYKGWAIRLQQKGSNWDEAEILIYVAPPGAWEHLVGQRSVKGGDLEGAFKEGLRIGKQFVDDAQ